MSVMIVWIFMYLFNGAKRDFVCEDSSFFSENSMKHMTVLCGKKAGFLNSKTGGNKETFGISRENPN